MTEAEILADLEAAAKMEDARQRLPLLAVKLLYENFDRYDWVGIYSMQGENELVLGPFIGKPSPHTRISIDKGVCGAAVRERATIIVDDVNADPRYLACSIQTNSEIVVPIFKGDIVVGEIDIDSHTPAAFTDNDKQFLEEVSTLLAAIY